MPIVTVEPHRQLGGASLRGRIGEGVGPLSKRRLDEAFGLTIGLWRIGSCRDVFEAQFAAGSGEGLRSVAGAVVGHDADDGDPKAGVVVNRRFEEGDSAFLALVGQDWKRRCAMRRRSRRERTPSRRRETCPAADRR